MHRLNEPIIPVRRLPKIDMSPKSQTERVINDQLAHKLAKLQPKLSPETVDNIFNKDIMDVSSLESINQVSFVTKRKKAKIA